MSPDKFVDYYEILQVSPMAEAEVIDAAYKKLAQKYHPDVNKSAGSAERMKKINAAYEVLGNHERRKNYHAQWLKGKSTSYNSRGHHIYFTADLHLHHKNIIDYCQRPFNDVDEMDEVLIAVWNRVITKSDTVYHLGDFYRTKDVNVYGKAMKMVHGRKLFLRGNHDDGLQFGDYYMCRRMGGIKIFMRHWPPWEHPQGKKYIHSFKIPFDVDVILCGHVHDKWENHYHIVGHRRIPVINVGVDVWGYKPVDLTSIKEEVGRLVTL